MSSVGGTQKSQGASPLSHLGPGVLSPCSASSPGAVSPSLYSQAISFSPFPNPTSLPFLLFLTLLFCKERKSGLNTSRGFQGHSLSPIPSGARPTRAFPTRLCSSWQACPFLLGLADHVCKILGPWRGAPSFHSNLLHIIPSVQLL